MTELRYLCVSPIIIDISQDSLIFSLGIILGVAEHRKK